MIGDILQNIVSIIAFNVDIFSIVIF